MNSPLYTDVLGIVKEVSDISHITTRQGNDVCALPINLLSYLTRLQLVKRELTIVDRSGASVRLTLWGRQAENFKETGEPIIAWKGVKVGDFGGKCLAQGQKLRYLRALRSDFVYAQLQLDGDQPGHS